MTEDGNHGGGTENEINAALFIHFSEACGNMALDMTPTMGSKYIEDAFQSIHQIDLVPTISVLLGLPIPYANIGGIVPSLIGSEGVNETAAALALNAAQVWRYFTVYSETANKLPNLSELQLHLEEAVQVYKQALAEQKNQAYDSTAFYKACGLFKTFLLEASELGHAVWTRFDTFGMIMGGAILSVVLAIKILSAFFVNGSNRPSSNQYVENGINAIFMIFQCGVLSFSNSYIAAEQRIVMFMLSILGIAIFMRMQGVTAGGNKRIIPYVPLLIPFLSRFSEIGISGHGMDPSLRIHIAHNPAIFLLALVGLVGLRVLFYSSFPIKNKSTLFHTVIDCAILLCLSLSWVEKRNLDQTRNGYAAIRVAIGILLLCTPVAIAEGLLFKLTKPQESAKVDGQYDMVGRDAILVHTLAIVFKLFLIMMVVTGPSTASTIFVFCHQGWMTYLLAGATGFYEVSTPIQATLWRLLIRHTFFATNHGCAFNRLQYSAAFVATMNFSFGLGGLQLFLNTFGWEIIGAILVSITSFMHGKKNLWSWYCFYQLLESFCNCISVSLLRRHLMVWAVYAPRFLFSSIFFILNSVGQIAVCLLLGSR
jgi:phosphatidylinositol glycan class O